MERRPDERVQGVAVKCGPSFQHSEDVCSSQCTPETSDQVLAQLTYGDTLDYQRFCFFECKPADGPASQLQTQCVALEAAEARLVVSTGGDALDPAFVYSGQAQVISVAPKASSLLDTRHSKEAAIQSRQEPVTASSIRSGVTTQEAHQAVFDGSQQARTQVAETVQHLSKTIEYENALAMRKAQLGADPYAAIADLRSATVGAQASAVKAEQDAQVAETVLRAIRGNYDSAAQGLASSTIGKARSETRAQLLAKERAAQEAALRHAEGV
jgi:hypothetical protein